jgi:hypothetical protein
MPCITSVLRGLTMRLTVGVSIAAVLIGRNAPVPEPAAESCPEVKDHARPRYRPYDGYWFPTVPHLPRLLDIERGVVLTFPLSDTERLDLLSCSPWQDGAGRFYLVGRWKGCLSPEPSALPRAFGLACCSFPGGEILERIPLDPHPTGNPCWYPNASGRVLFAASGRLYQVTVRGKAPAKTDAPVEPVQPRLLPWRAGPPGRGVDYIQDLHWPNDGSLSLRWPVLASLSFWQPTMSASASGRHLWWLDLGPEGTEVVAAGLLISPDPTESPARRDEERHPVVGTSHDGMAMLAYLALEAGCATWDLWLAPIARSGMGQVLTIPASACRKLAGGCKPVAPAFSADGRWVYAVRHAPGRGPRLERFPVAPEDDPPRLAAMK